MWENWANVKRFPRFSDFFFVLFIFVNYNNYELKKKKSNSGKLHHFPQHRVCESLVCLSWYFVNEGVNTSNVNSLRDCWPHPGNLVHLCIHVGPWKKGKKSQSWGCPIDEQWGWSSKVSLCVIHVMCKQTHFFCPAQVRWMQASVGKPRKETHSLACTIDKTGGGRPRGLFRCLHQAAHSL